MLVVWLVASWELAGLMCLKRLSENSAAKPLELELAMVAGPVVSAAETAGVAIDRSADAVDIASAGIDESDHFAAPAIAGTVAAGTATAQFAHGDVADDMAARVGTA